MSYNKSLALFVAVLALWSNAGAEWHVPIPFIHSSGMDNLVFLSYSQTPPARTLSATAGDSLHVVWMNQDGPGIINVFYKHSFDGGLNWSEAISLTDITGDEETVLVPCISVFGSNVHVAWLHGDFSDFSCQGVEYRHSTDAGLTWSQIIYIAPGYEGALSEVNPMIEARGDRVHVTWAGYGIEPGDNRAKAFYSTSFDNGQTWNQPQQISQHSSESGLSCGSAALAVTGDEIHIAWVASQSSSPNSRSYYRHSLDGGLTWGDQRQIDNNPNRSMAPQIAVTENASVHVTWEENTGGEAWSVRYARSLNNGETWETPISLDAGVPGVFSTGAFLQSRGSDLHVVFSRIGNDPNYIIHYRNSGDEGATWSEDTVMVQHSLMPSMAVSDSRLYMIWSYEFMSQISFTYNEDFTIPHGPCPFDLISPMDDTLLTLLQAGDVTFLWGGSVDPDIGDTVTYTFHAAVTTPGLPPVNLLHEDIEDTSFTINLLTESGYEHPTDTLTVAWWVTASSPGGIAHSNSDFQFKVEPEPSGIDRRLAPRSFALYDASPNPFNPTTTISFDLPMESRVSLVVYNIIGQPVKTMLDDQVPAGMHSITFDGTQLPSGIYFYSMNIGAYSETKKMMLLK